MTATVSISQRILDAVHSTGGVTYDELRYQLTKRGGDIGRGSLALAVGDLIDTGRIRVRGGVITRREST